MSDSFNLRAPAGRYRASMTTKFSAIGLGGEDLAATLAFYRLLGVQVPDGAESQPHVEVTVPGGVRLMWDNMPQLRKMDPTIPEPDSEHAGASLAFDCGTPDEVDRTYARVVAAGHRGAKEPWDAFWGQRYACVLDPNGIQVDLFAALPS